MQVTPQNFAETNGGRERRERPRRAPSSLSYVSVDNANGGVIVDISEMGMAISSAQALMDGGTHTLRFQLPRIDRMFETLPASQSGREICAHLRVMTPVRKFWHSGSGELGLSEKIPTKMLTMK